MLTNTSNMRTTYLTFLQTSLYNCMPNLLETSIGVDVAKNRQRCSIASICYLAKSNIQCCFTNIKYLTKFVLRILEMSFQSPQF